MRRSTTHLLTTHTGSLPRPPALVQHIHNRDSGAADGLPSDAEIRDAVALLVGQQADVGLTVVNDGEASKVSYGTYVADRLSGFDGESSAEHIAPGDLADFPEFAPPGSSAFDVARPACTGPIAYPDLGAVRADIENLRTAVAGQPGIEDVFLTAASPGVIALTLQDHHHATHEDYVGALAEAMKAEYDEIHRAGLVLQLDCPDLAGERHMQMDLSLEDFRRRAQLHVEALNHATRDIPPEAMRIHLCWGNYEGPHHHDVPLRDILDIVLRARPAGISFEAANPRHAHEWTVFEDTRLPEGKVLIPGVLDSTTNYIEHPELVCQHLVRFAELVGRENVIAGTDCGFSTFAGFEMVSPPIAWAKLRALVDGAHLASSILWRDPPG